MLGALKAMPRNPRAPLAPEPPLVECHRLGCGGRFPRNTRGRPRKYCSDRCRDLVVRGAPTRQEPVHASQP